MAKIPTIVKRDSHGYVNKKARKSDSIKNESSSKVRKYSAPKKITNKQIRKNPKKGMFVGIDLHKKFLQVING